MFLSLTAELLMSLQAAYYVGLFLLPLGDAVTINLVGPAVTATAARIFLKEPLG